MQDTSAEQMTAPKPPVCWCQGASLQAQLAQMNPKLTQVNPKLSSPQQSSVGPGPCPWSQVASRQRWTEGQTYPSSSLGLHRARTQLGQTCTSPGRSLEFPRVNPTQESPRPQSQGSTRWGMARTSFSRGLHCEVTKIICLQKGLNHFWFSSPWV